MQTSRSQTQPPRKEIAALSVSSNSSNSYINLDDKFRFRLGLAVFYPYALFFTLFIGLVYRHKDASTSFLLRAASVLVVSNIFLVLSYVLISAVLRERRNQLKEVSRAACLMAIADVLNAFAIPIREKVKQVGRLLAEEGDVAGWRCRIVLQDNSIFLPPARPGLGLQVPLTAGDVNVGALIVTSVRRLAGIDNNFFDGLSRLLGPFLYKEKLWDDFHAEVDRVQASLLLNAITTPDSKSPPENLTVEHMLGTLGFIKGKVDNSVDNKL